MTIRMASIPTNTTERIIKFDWNRIVRDCFTFNHRCEGQEDSPKGRVMTPEEIQLELHKSQFEWVVAHLNPLLEAQVAKRQYKTLHILDRQRLQEMVTQDMAAES